MQIIPTPLPPRHDGWTPERQAQFLEALADCGIVAEAALRAGMSKQSAYQLRRRADAAEFAAGWDAALVEGWRRIEETAMERAIGGELEIIDRDGVTITRHRPCSPQLMIAMLDRAERARLAAKAAQSQVNGQMIGPIMQEIKAMAMRDAADKAARQANFERGDSDIADDLTLGECTENSAADGDAGHDRDEAGDGADHGPDHGADCGAGTGTDHGTDQGTGYGDADSDPHGYARADVRADRLCGADAPGAADAAETLESRQDRKVRQLWPRGDAATRPRGDAATRPRRDAASGDGSDDRGAAEFPGLDHRAAAP